MLSRVLKSFLGRRPSAKPIVDRALSCYRAGAFGEAEQLLRTAVSEHPSDAAVLTNLALVLLVQNRGAEAAGLLEKALALDPQCAPAHCNYATLLLASGRLEDAITHYRAACRADPDFDAATDQLLHALLQACDWDGADIQAARLRKGMARASADKRMALISPLTALFLRLDAQTCKQVAAYHADVHAQHPANRVTLRARSAAVRPQRLKIGYFSGDFREHAVGRLLNTAFALHDRGRFETYAFSFGPDDGSRYREAIASSVDHFVDIAALSDADAAQTIADCGIDVLVDLMGHTTGTRFGVLARRPAPVQTHFLGYPATTGASYIDYFVSDRVVTPPDPGHHFTETLVHVAECYMLSDGAEARGVIRAARADHGLPEAACVYTNFSTPSRIDRESFALWMRILDAVPQSVLWLLGADLLVVKNLEREASSRGVDPQRLIFGARESHRPAHLGRLACADLALDTLGWYNGHTTTADMLWAGVPVLTAPGGTFATRVAASLVTAAGLPELAVRTPGVYVTTAIALGHDRARTRALRDKLREARDIAPFFRTDRLIRDLETAYDAMYAGKIEPFAGL